MMAGMKVIYASAPRRWSLSWPVATEADLAAATGSPQAGQKALTSGICAPHWEQLTVNTLPPEGPARYRAGIAVFSRADINRNRCVKANLTCATISVNVRQREHSNACPVTRRTFRGKCVD